MNIIFLTAATLGCEIELPYEPVEVVGTSPVEAAPSWDGRKGAFVTCSVYWHGNMHCPSLTLYVRPCMDWHMEAEDSQGRALFEAVVVIA